MSSYQHLKIDILTVPRYSERIVKFSFMAKTVFHLDILSSQGMAHVTNVTNIVLLMY